MQFERPEVPWRRRGSWETRLDAVSPVEVTALAGEVSNGGAALILFTGTPASTGRTRASNQLRKTITWEHQKTHKREGKEKGQEEAAGTCWFTGELQNTAVDARSSGE